MPTDSRVAVDMDIQHENVTPCTFFFPVARNGTTNRVFRVLGDRDQATQPPQLLLIGLSAKPMTI